MLHRLRLTRMHRLNLLLALLVAPAAAHAARAGDAAPTIATGGDWRVAVARLRSSSCGIRPGALRTRSATTIWRARLRPPTT